jgi:serine/threonine protein kinase
MMLFIMLTAVSPFERDQFRATNQESVQAEDLLDKMSAAAEDLLDKMSAAAPEQRWTFAQVQQHPWLAGEQWPTEKVKVNSVLYLIQACSARLAATSRYKVPVVFAVHSY